MNENKSKDKEIKPHDFIDITSDTCPMTFVKTKLRLEKLAGGEILEVLLNNGEPLKNVPLSAEELGHIVMSVETDMTEGTSRLLIQKKPG